MPTHQDLDVKRPGLGGDGDDAPESEIDDSAQFSMEQKPVEVPEVADETPQPAIVTPTPGPPIGSINQHPVEESKNVEESKLPPIGSGRCGLAA